MEDTKVFEFPSDFSEQEQKCKSNKELFTYYKKILDGYETKDNEANIEWLDYDHYLLKENRVYYIKLKDRKKKYIFKLKTDSPANHLENSDELGPVVFKIGISKTSISSASVTQLKKEYKFALDKHIDECDYESNIYIKKIDQIVEELFSRLDVKGE